MVTITTQGISSGLYRRRETFDGAGRSIAVGSRHGHRGALMLEGTSPPLYLTRGMVPLERMNIIWFAIPGTDDINDFLFVISHSLRDLCINAQVDVLSDLPRSIHLIGSTFLS
jgi:hypothetical protein